MHYPVTRDHYEKYSALSAASRVRFNITSYKFFGFQTLSELVMHYRRDTNLSSLSPALFFAWIASARLFNKTLRARADYELVCLAKHCLLNHTLEARPRFIEKNEATL